MLGRRSLPLPSHGSAEGRLVLERPHRLGAHVVAPRWRHRQHPLCVRRADRVLLLRRMWNSHSAARSRAWAGPSAGPGEVCAPLSGWPHPRAGSLFLNDRSLPTWPRLLDGATNRTGSSWPRSTDNWRSYAPAWSCPSGRCGPGQSAGRRSRIYGTAARRSGRSGGWSRTVSPSRSSDVCRAVSTRTT